MDVRHGSYGRCLVAIAFAYLASYGTFLACTDGVPYVCDANESFGTFWHAYNLYHFDLSQSCGITDDACSTNPAAHPYVHTHQGNFPRLFAFLIYLLGARSIESQVVVTTLTVGLAAMLFAYHFFARVVAPRFGLLACLILMSDYVLIAQWHVVTYRVWHCFFLFSSLLCVRGAGGPRRRTWAALTFVNFACLFYYEYVFVFFVFVTSSLYAAWIYRHRWRTALRSSAWSAAGGATGVLVFLGQLVAYMGVDGVLQDAAITLNSRLYSAAGGSLPAEVTDFYERHNILFLYNLYDGRTMLTGLHFWWHFFTFHLGPYTPLFALVVLIIVAGWLQGLLLDRLGAGRHTGLRIVPAAGLARPRELLWRQRFRAGAAFVLFALCSHAFFVSSFRDQAYAGYYPMPPFAWLDEDMLVNAASLGAAAGFCLLLSRRITGAWWGLGTVPVVRLVCAGATLVAVAWVMRNHSVYYAQDIAALWYAMRKLFYFRACEHLVLAGAAFLGVGLILAGKRFVGVKGLGPLSGLVPYFACGASAYGLVYYLAGGYLFTGYLTRWESFFAFFTNVLVSVGIWLVLHFAVREVRRLRRPWVVGSTTPAGPSRIRLGWALLRRVLDRPCTAALAALLLLFLVVHWVRLQVLYVEALPPDYYDFLQVLRAPPYRGATFVSNTYANPLACATGQWTYADAGLFQGKISFEKNHYEITRDRPPYLWFADQKTNPAYARPEYGIIVTPQNLPTAANRLLSKGDMHGTYPVWRDGGILARCPEMGQAVLWHPVVAQDPSTRHRWAIVKLDWHFPPYLADLPGDDWVQIQTDSRSAGTRIEIVYRYVHQEGAVEQGTRVRLYVIGDGDEERPLQEGIDQHNFYLPASFSGKIRASVQPSTAHKAGLEYFSPLVHIKP